MLYIIIMAAEGERAEFDLETGAALNDAAEQLVQNARADRARSRNDETAVQTAMRNPLEDIPSVHIDPGTWKYVQIRLRKDGNEKLVVRAYRGLRFHAENYETAMRKFRPLGIRGDVIGGGRIKYDPEEKQVSVYGYSKTFGRAVGCNAASAALIENSYPGFQVTWSDEGY